MQLNQRDLDIIQRVALFGWLSSKQIRAIFFSSLSSHTPYDRTMKRLFEEHYLGRIERRLIGGKRGGSGQYIYKLGTQGRIICPDARRTPPIHEVEHTLLVADCYIALLRLERAGRLAILGYLTEPDNAITVDSERLEPDLLIDITQPDGSNRLCLLIEADRSTENSKRITEKLVRYWKAYQAGAEQLPTDMRVLWVVLDDTRAQELRWLLERGTTEQTALFRIHTLKSLTAAFGGLSTGRASLARLCIAFVLQFDKL